MGVPFSQFYHVGAGPHIGLVRIILGLACELSWIIAEGAVDKALHDLSQCADQLDLHWKRNIEIRQMSEIAFELGRVDLIRNILISRCFRTNALRGLLLVVARRGERCQLAGSCDGVFGIRHADGASLQQSTWLPLT